MAKLTDNSLMPFGKHKGTAMANVPASYLLWLKNNVEKVDSAVLEYINDNLDVLRNENGAFDKPLRTIK